MSYEVDYIPWLEREIYRTELCRSKTDGGYTAMAGRELTNGIKQRFKLNTVGRSPSEIQRGLEQMGVKGFVYT